MALIGYTITVVAKQDNPYNVLPETDISIRKNSDNTLVNIYADEAGLIPIAQLGAKTDANGQFTFYADASLGILKAVWTNGGVIATEVLDKSDHSRLVNRNAVGAHDAIYRRETTVSEIATGVFSVGDKLTVTDRGNAQFNVVIGGAADGYGVLNAGTGKTAEVVHVDGVVSLAAFGAVGDGVAPASPFTSQATGTDNYLSIRAAFNYAQKYFGRRVSDNAQGLIEVVGESGAMYMLSGDNPLGSQSPSDVITYEFDGNGCCFLWNVPADGVFIRDMYRVFRPSFLNFRLFTYGYTGGRGGFLSTNAIDGEDQQFASMTMENVEVVGGQTFTGATKWIDFIFDIDGYQLCDRASIKDCQFYMFDSFYKSTNPEAVSWSFLNCHIHTHVDGAVLFNHDGAWSGGMDIWGCDLLMKGPNQTMFLGSLGDDTLPVYNNGNVSVKSRVETASGVTQTILKAFHGDYTFESANFSNGNSNLSSGAITAAELYGTASVRFTDCIIPNKIRQHAQTQTEYTSYRSNGVYRHQFLSEGSVVAGGYIDYRLIDISGAEDTFRTKLSQDRFTGVCKSFGTQSNNATFGLISGLNDNEMNTFVLGYRNGGGYLRPYTNTTTGAVFSLRMPPYQIVRSLKIYSRSVVATTATHIGVYFGENLITSVPISDSVRTVTEAIPSDKQGISIPLTGSTANSYISIRAMLGGVPITTGFGSIIAYARVQFEPITDLNCMPATDAPAIV